MKLRKIKNKKVLINKKNKMGEGNKLNLIPGEGNKDLGVKKDKVPEKSAGEASEIGGKIIEDAKKSKEKVMKIGRDIMDNDGKSLEEEGVEWANEEIKRVAEKERLDNIEKGMKRVIVLAKELSESKKILPYPGINPDRYQEMKFDEEDYPGFAMPIDDLIKRFQGEGMKIILGNDPESGNFHILPSGSDDFKNDSLLPRHLEVNELMDPRIKELISIQKGFKKK